MPKQKIVHSPKQTGKFSAARMSYYASNFPHPDHLERYEKLFPGAIGPDVFDKDENRHLGIVAIPIPTLKGNASILRELREKLFSHLASASATVLTALYTPPWVPVALALIYSLTVAFIYKYGKDKQAESQARKRERQP